MKPFELNEKDCNHKYNHTLDYRCPGCGKQFSFPKNIRYIPDDKIAYLDLNKDVEHRQDMKSFYGITRNPQVQLKRATEVPLIHDVIGLEAKAKEDLMTGPIPIDPELVKASSPYIFNLLHMTKDDHLVISRRAITCSIARPFTKDLGNGYCEQTWLGDITKWPMYVEYDEEFK